MASIHHQITMTTSCIAAASRDNTRRTEANAVYVVTLGTLHRYLSNTDKLLAVAIFYKCFLENTPNKFRPFSSIIKTRKYIVAP